MVDKEQLKYQDEVKEIRAEFKEFKQLLLESTRELLTELEMKRTAATRRELARLSEEAGRAFKKELARTKAVEFKRMYEKDTERLEKRLRLVEEVVHTKIATTELVDRKLENAQERLKDEVESRTNRELTKAKAELSKEIAKEKIFDILNSVREDLKTTAAERKDAQTNMRDIINTIEEVREEMDNMRGQLKEEILSTARKLTDDEDSDVAAVIGQIGELKSEVKKIHRGSK